MRAAVPKDEVEGEFGGPTKLASVKPEMFWSLKAFEPMKAFAEAEFLVGFSTQSFFFGLNTGTWEATELHEPQFGSELSGFFSPEVLVAQVWEVSDKSKTRMDLSCHHVRLAHSESVSLTKESLPRLRSHIPLTRLR